MRQPVFGLLLFGGVLAVGVAAESPGSQALTPLATVNSQLPRWIQFNGEVRFREEGFLGNQFTKGEDDMYLLQRFRLGVQIKPLPWLQMYVQGQDSRVSFTDRANPAPYRDSADLRQAWIQLGQSEKGPATVRVGRQELAYGEERLVGASNWGNTACVFDAVKAQFRHGGYHLDAFAASVVVPKDHFYDRHSDGDNLHGLWGGIDHWIPGATLEPFAFWRLAPFVRTEEGATGKLDSKTTGIRWNGKLPHSFEYTTEMVLQRGSWGADSVQAWAGFWRLGRFFPNTHWQPHFRFEANHASGDGNPLDGKHQTFEVLYPTPHDKYGMADQVGWKNVNHMSFIAEATPRRALVLQAKWHNRWLAEARDGLYNSGGALLARDITGQSGTHIGQEIDFQAVWTPRPNILLGGGMGHIFPGQFLKNTTPGHSYSFPYVMLTFGL